MTKSKWPERKPVVAGAQMLVQSQHAAEAVTHLERWFIAQGWKPDATGALVSPDGQSRMER